LTPWQRSSGEITVPDHRKQRACIDRYFRYRKGGKIPKIRLKKYSIRVSLPNSEAGFGPVSGKKDIEEYIMERSL